MMWLAGWLLALTTAAGALHPDSIRARKLRLAAYDRLAVYQDDSAFALFLAAYRADPGYYPAQRSLLDAMPARFDAARQRRIVADALGATPSDIACLTTQIRDQGSATAMWDDLHALVRRYGPSPCLQGGIGMLVPALTDSAHAHAVRTALNQALAATHDSPDLVAVLAGYRQRRGDTVSAIAALRRARDASAGWLSWISMQIQIIRLDSLAGRIAQMHAEIQRLDLRVRRDGRPAVHAEAIEQVCILRQRGCGALLGLVALAASYGDAMKVAMLSLDFGGYFTGTGRPAAAIPLFRRAAATADSARWPPLETQAWTDLGRAYMKAGRWRDGVAALHRALRTVDPENVYWRAEIYHNLAHSYESAGRLNDAVRTVDRFVALASRLSGDGSSVISLYDAGVMNWEAGLHVAARTAFDSMVHVIDARRKNYFYAGDYYERVGDLRRALRYYRAVNPRSAEEGARALAGLARVYDALGMPDSAEAAAREHDLAIQTPEEVPLMPAVLAAHGLLDSALAIARAWADSQIAGGNVNGAARAELSVAALLASGGRPQAALAEAQRAESLAVRGNVVDVRVGAKTAQTAVLLAMGRPRRALAEAERITAADLAGATDEERMDAEVAVGDALGAAGRDAAALARYDAAGRLVDRMADALTADADRARLRAHRMAPFDHAVALLLREPPSAARTDALVRWAQRRTAAAFPDPVAHAADLRRPLPAPLSVARIVQRLRPRSALVDYVLLDGTVAALVIRPSKTSVVRLPTTRATVDRLVLTLRRRLASTYGAEEDLSRSVVDSAAADSLSAILFAPIAPLLAGITRLAVIPDGALYLLPFDLLPVGRSGTLLDRFALSVLPSPAFLAGPDRRLPPGGDALLAVAGTAPGAEREVAYVRQAWTRGPVTVAQPSAASAAFVRRALARYSILHFATHAVADAVDPLRSRLVLGPSRAAGVFDVSDIEALITRARLVVLSACETDGGPLVEGVGPMGLARAFLVSGSRAVIATEWPVGAPTADLMRVFYKDLASGEPADEALRAAKLAVRGNSAIGQPFNWAGFVLIGDPDGALGAR